MSVGKLTSHKNSQTGGFTLIEVLVSMVILVIGMFGLLRSINLALDVNLRNQMRQNAVDVAEQQLSDMKARPFDNITGGGVSAVRVATRSAFKSYSVQRGVTDLATSASKTKQISVRVWWRYKGVTYEHQIASGIGNKAL
jgi:type IV pilus assembly protein PilV